MASRWDFEGPPRPPAARPRDFADDDVLERDDTDSKSDSDDVSHRESDKDSNTESDKESNTDSDTDTESNSGRIQAPSDIKAEEQGKVQGKGQWGAEAENRLGPRRRSRARERDEEVRSASRRENEKERRIRIRNRDSDSNTDFEFSDSNSASDSDFNGKTHIREDSGHERQDATEGDVKGEERNESGSGSGSESGSGRGSESGSGRGRGGERGNHLNYRSRTKRFRAEENETAPITTDYQIPTSAFKPAFQAASISAFTSNPELQEEVVGFRAERERHEAEEKARANRASLTRLVQTVLLDPRNRSLTDDKLDALLPPDGYKIIAPPPDYKRSPIFTGELLKALAAADAGPDSDAGGEADGRTAGGERGEAAVLKEKPLPSNSASAPASASAPGSAEAEAEAEAPFAGVESGGFSLGGGVNDTYTIPEPLNRKMPAAPELSGEDISMSSRDYEFFAALFEDVDLASLPPAEARGREVLLLLLKIKNGTPLLRRGAMRTLTARMPALGPEAVFDKLLPLAVFVGADEGDRHLMVKLIDRALHRFDEQVRPFVKRILIVVEPLLMEKDFYARAEGREVVANLAKAAGLPTMIAALRGDLESIDDYVRNVTARAFGVMASALGIPSLVPFLKVLCRAKRSHLARLTGVKIIQQIAILLGYAALPHLKALVQIVAPNLLSVEEPKIRIVTALTLAALAEASHPYGVEAFEPVLPALWQGVQQYRGKGLAAFVKALAFVLPLMAPEHAQLYARELFPILKREFDSPDEESRRIVLLCLRKCVETEGVEKDWIRSAVFPPYFKAFYTLRNALQSHTVRELLETSLAIARKVKGALIVSNLLPLLNDPGVALRALAVRTVEVVTRELGGKEIGLGSEELLIDRLLFCFQEESADDLDAPDDTTSNLTPTPNTTSNLTGVPVSNRGFSGKSTTPVLRALQAAVHALRLRAKPLLPQISGVVRWRLNNADARMRRQSAELIALLARDFHVCGEDDILKHFALILHEFLGEEFPETLASILRALHGVIALVKIEELTPPVHDLLPRLTPILRNRHEGVQAAVIDLMGTIAERSGDMISPKEWDRISFDLLELLKARRKNIRRAAVNCFGWIAKSIGPQDVMLTLLNNLRVQERQLRVCTTVAIAIVAESCLPYTVLPALMNEYRTPDTNVQHGVLKALSFMFEYIGEMSRDYVYSLVPLLTDALRDRDVIHRQTAIWASAHLALSLAGLSCEDALMDLFNHVWPNVFESVAHLQPALFDALQAFRVALGPGIIFRYIIQGLWHPARRVREVYWRIYNMLFIGGPDALVAFYPPIPNDPPYAFYDRPELCLTL